VRWPHVTGDKGVTERPTAWRSILEDRFDLLTGNATKPETRLGHKAGMTAAAVALAIAQYDRGQGIVVLG
jgi:hypothetical protein